MNGKFVKKKNIYIYIKNCDSHNSGQIVRPLIYYALLSYLFMDWLILNKNICLLVCSVINQMMFKAWTYLVFYKVVAKPGSISCSFTINSNDVPQLNRMLYHFLVIILKIIGFSHYVTQTNTGTPTNACWYSTLIKYRNKKDKKF
jgi:hypothetical protein